MPEILGAQVTLYQKVITGYDEIGDPLWRELPIVVDDVLISPVSTQEQIDSIRLFGKATFYQLAIPKGDHHDWEDARVEFFDEAWQTVGCIEQGIEENVPLRWHKKIKVVRYE